jgi:hypothetical protein
MFPELARAIHIDCQQDRIPHDIDSIKRRKDLKVLTEAVKGILSQ